MHFELFPFIVWIALWVVNTYSEFQVDILSKNRDITKCQSFCTPMKTPRPYKYCTLNLHQSTAELKMTAKIGKSK